MGSHLELRVTSTETAATLGRQTESSEKRAPILALISSSLITVLSNSFYFGPQFLHLFFNLYSRGDGLNLIISLKSNHRSATAYCSVPEILVIPLIRRIN